MIGPKKHLSFTALRKKMSSFFQEIPEWRQGSKIKINIHDALMSGFACMHFQEPSLLQFQTNLEEEHHRNNLKTLFGVQNIPKETQMREIIDEVDSDYFSSIFKNYYLRLQRGKHLEDYQIFPGLYYFPMDGSQFFSSEDIHCEHCLTKTHRNGKKTYSHQVLQGGMMHPDQSEVIPFMPEPISNEDGEDKQDCEMNGAKRYVKKLRAAHPQLGLIIGGDSLFSRQPLIEDILKEKAHYLFTAKPEDHKYMFEWLEAYKELKSFVYSDKNGYTHHYEWMNEVPLNGREDSVLVNFFRYRMTTQDDQGVEKIVYKSSWVTDIAISAENIKILVRTGRCRWKEENEIFNVMKNHGYYMDRNYGHGQKNLSFNFYLLTLLAFFFHQIFELTDRQYQACRKKFGSKKHLWEKLRAYIEILIFDTWEALLEFAVSPKKGLVTWANAP
ncbi:MAG TPA: hypothetical protein VEK38_01170 [Candidatus Bathyarchaeia archaeon]|nr:hypothetical protein [Candidatus Bathyarchaeia archaeon]